VRIAAQPRRPYATPLVAATRAGLPHTVFQPVLYRAMAALPQVQVQELRLPQESWMRIKRTTSTMWESVGAPQQKTFHCPFCLENVRELDRFIFSNCGSESHGVCRDCTGHYIRGLVTDGRVGKIGCHQCGAAAAPAEVLQLTDEPTFKKYERFQQMQQDHTVRECPVCGKFGKPELDEEGNPVAEMRCEECSAEFCYYHSNAHSRVPCAEYRKKVAREERLAEQGVLRDTKACPNCGVRTEKTGGCNHMTCQRCTSDWCWVCGEKLDDVTTHYYFGGPFACGQFEDFEPRSPLSYAIRCITVPLQLLAVLLFVLFSLTMLVWFPLVYILLTPCYFSCRTCQMSPTALKCILLCSIVLSFIPFVAFQLVWTMVAAVIWFFLRICGAERRHLYNLVRAPVIAVLPVLICFQVLVEHFRGGDDEFRGAVDDEFRTLEAAGHEAAPEQPSSDLEAASADSSEDSSSSSSED